MRLFVRCVRQSMKPQFSNDSAKARFMRQAANSTSTAHIGHPPSPQHETLPDSPPCPTTSQYGRPIQNTHLCYFCLSFFLFLSFPLPRPTPPTRANWVHVGCGPV